MYFVAVATAHSVLNPYLIEVVESESFSFLEFIGTYGVFNGSSSFDFRHYFWARGSIPALTNARALSRSLRMAVISLVG